MLASGMNWQKIFREMKDEYKSTAHSKYLCQYHLVWCPKFRYSVLKADTQSKLKHIFEDIAKRYEYEMLELEIMPDHIHLFVGAKPTVAPMDIARRFKSISAIELFKVFPSLKRFYGRCGSLWSTGKFVSTIGKVSAATIRKYIQEQTGK